MKKIKTYMGDLGANDFDLMANRFIVRNKEISFDLSGSDEDGGRFNLTGTAKLLENGIYEGANLRYRYEGYNYDNDDEIATITINELTDNNKKLHVKGVWHEDGEGYNFEGNLVPWIAK
ncbi:MAG: hypothetical protein DRQ51_07860 [Gammaproteobacteria bacterium]|nr:MAG: hypothetical protein DRQ51_07860 [Gammaproteobacteria bacterium]